MNSLLDNPVKILLVEDNKGDSLLIKLALKESSYENAILFEASSLTEALNFSEEDVLIILLDLNLPDSDGLKTVKYIREYFPDSAVIVLTGLNDQGIAVETLREGVQNYLSKDEIDSNLLDKTIRFSLERHMILQKLRSVDKELIQNKFFLEKAQEVAHMGSWVMDIKSNTAVWSDETQRIFGFIPGEFDQSMDTFFKMIHPADLEELNLKANRSILEKKLLDHTHRIIRKDGVMRWMHSKAETFYDSSGNPLKMIGSVHDITERKENEEKIKKGNRLYSYISHINQIIVHVKNEQTLFYEACRIAVEYGKFSMAWIGIPDPDKKTISLVASEGISQHNLPMFSKYKFDVNGPIEKVLQGMEYCVVNDIQKELGINWKGYSEKHGYNSAISLAIEKSGKVIGTFNIYSEENNFFDTEEVKTLNESANDISFALDTYEVEKQRKRAEANLRTIFENTTTGYVLFDENFKIVSFNHHAQQFANDDLHQILKVGNDAISYYSGKQQEAVSDIMTRTLKGETIETEASFKQLDGSTRWYETKFFPVNNQQMKSHGIIMSLVNNSEKKIMEIEREKITADLIGRNKDLEQFSYIVSHNLRLPVANIIGFSDILMDPNINQDQKEDFIKAILDSVKKLDEVVNDLNLVLQTRREINENREEVYFKKLVDNIIDSIRSLVDKDNVKIITDFSSIEKMFTIKSYLYSIFYNLISNSIKYKQPDVPLIIEIKSELNRKGFSLYFKDNGSGIDLNKNKEQVFGLYKRFHKKVEGKGMGLYMVKTQAETLGGRIDIKSELNIGTEFRLDFNNYKFN